MIDAVGVPRRGRGEGPLTGWIIVTVTFPNADLSGFSDNGRLSVRRTDRLYSQQIPT